jgi:hypothetical protein
MRDVLGRSLCPELRLAALQSPERCRGLTQLVAGTGATQQQPLHAPRMLPGGQPEMGSSRVHGAHLLALCARRGSSTSLHAANAVEPKQEQQRVTACG